MSRYVLTTAVLVTLAGVNTAKAQTITLNPQYAANPPGGGPPNANPVGTYNIPASNLSWQVEIDYGTFGAGGVFNRLAAK